MLRLGACGIFRLIDSLIQGDVQFRNRDVGDGVWGYWSRGHSWHVTGMRREGKIKLWAIPIFNRRLKTLWHTFCSVPPFGLMGNTAHQAQHSWESLSTMFSAIVVCWLLSSVCLFMIPWPAACHASLSFTISQSLLKLMSIESVMPSHHLILCHHHLLLPSISPSIRVFFNESALCIRWPKYWSFDVSPSNKYSRLISASGLRTHCNRSVSTRKMNSPFHPLLIFI